MSLEGLKSVLRGTGVDLWTLIETAISLAASEHETELRARRDGIVGRLYSLPDGRCKRCDGKMEASPSKGKADEEPVVDHAEDNGVDDERNYHSMDDVQLKILAIKDFLDDPDQPEDSLINLLQNLADMEINFKALKETDIGRHVNSLRKHPSSEVKRIVKQLVRKWKETVDEWVKSNSANDHSSPANITDGDSPQLIPAKSNQNGHQTQDFIHSSPNLSAQNGNWLPDRNGAESTELKARSAPRGREASTKPFNYNATTAKERDNNKESLLDPDRLASARKRLQENYQEIENAKRQRTIQVMDIHDIPKPKNAFLGRSKAGFHANKRC